MFYHRRKKYNPLSSLKELKDCSIIPGMDHVANNFGLHYVFLKCGILSGDNGKGGKYFRRHFRGTILPGIVFSTGGENEELQRLSCVIKYKALTGDSGG